MALLDAHAKYRNLPREHGNTHKAHQAQGNLPPPGGAHLPACSQDPTMWYCYGFGETYGQSYNGFREWGNDNDTPFHTDLYIPYGGVVTDASYHGWGGQVGVSANVPGHGQLIEYVQHLDLIDPLVFPGMPLNPGDHVGISGGQIGYGYHPEDPKYTSGPHTEFGFGAPWINGAQGCQPGASCNPNSVFMFNDARAGNLNGTISGGTPGGPGPFGFQIDPCTWPIFGWFCPNSGINWTDILIRILLVISGAVCIYIAADHIWGSDDTLPEPTPSYGSSSGSGSGKDEEEEEDEEKKEEGEKEEGEKKEAVEKTEKAEQTRTQAQATERKPAAETQRPPAAETQRSPAQAESSEG